MTRFVALFLLAAHCASAQDPAPATPNAKPVVNLWLNRNGFLAKENYIYSEWFQIHPTRHPKWALLLPDIGLVAFNDIGHYREVFVGGGLEIYPTKALTIDEEGYWVQSSGPDSAGKFFYMPWTRIEYDFPKRWVTETVLFPYIPLNGGPTMLIWERSKLQFNGFKRFNVGAGYASRQDFTHGIRDNRPFATVTLKTAHLGDFEVWVQKFPGSSVQLQLRHSMVWHTR